MVRLSITVPVTLFLVVARITTAFPSSISISTARDVLATLERRQSSCPATSPISCRDVDPKLPSDFCCQTGSSCISLDSSSTALCCPDGNTCDTIVPIDCDVSLEDPAKNGPIFTTRLSDTLTQCSGSNKCCPFGYTCSKGTDGSAACQIIASKAISKVQNTTTSSAPTATSPPPSSATASGAASTPSTASPASASSIDSSKPPSSQSANPFPPTVFLAGFFPGILVGALGVLAWVILTGRHKSPGDRASITSSIYKNKPYISGPIPLESHSSRTDFLRRGTKSAKTLFSKRKSELEQDQGTPGLPFDNWKMPTPPEPNNIPQHPMGRLIPAGPGAKFAPEGPGHPPGTQYPVTPERQIYGHDATSETEVIHVYSPREMEFPSATVAPLRGMNSRDRSRSSAASHPYGTPNRGWDAQSTAQRKPSYPYESTFDPKRPRQDSSVQHGRPETTFTAMLEAIDFPDPMNRQAPRMPGIPNQYR